LRRDFAVAKRDLHREIAVDAALRGNFRETAIGVSRRFDIDVGQ
jgi:hypothetical protein